MTAICGLDLSLTSAGIACIELAEAQIWDHDGATVESVISNVTVRSLGHAGHRTDSWDTRETRIVRQVVDVMAHVPSEAILAVIEGPAYGKNLPSSFDRAGLWWGIKSAVRARGIPTAICPPTTRASWATGKGNADKAAVVDAISQMWPATRLYNDDQADALVLASIGAQRLGVQLPFPLKDRHHLACDSVAWPAEVAR